ncbi:polyprenyl synthetase family protein [Leptospira borgpetersenii serovar Hardjo-bovis]|uniref:Polyprenyl synthetase n=1 Tax=Leptospira borgpetersenii serovar Hardjo-bovis str. Sponselee TaxID=1303729 RepID=M6C0R4_LEPBO|nr:polyprenyl synthetase family protein [Leptospira borgpetersenii]ABJ78274.1 Geranyltranstransferase [Leptospira borgpetersenii serovar Hardjo-bovis str. L550]AMX57496.1 geranylgeranyl pyrophosphate synthase [Leptospira borgpetersenii serovar Hardjo]AMX60727.1 geranylgeranyl pyrophosphate synthase [Leptospira borgpetersenii serovar Hardjo]AMX63972.1 geranylgeranyl pyrophosphate synthase [Leptospira borgpetersenii serovar Hardjo]AMX67212.1 geranylgeranyl pyrophosphate synthase [Leptospira borg
MSLSSFSAIFHSYRVTFENFLNSQTLSILSEQSAPELFEAMKYSLVAGGKRLRPVLVLAAFGGSQNETRNTLLLGSSLECIHTYSLIHDDLPSMDNDDFRRGLPTLHKRFSEATAILTGDALNSFAFYFISLIQGDNEDYFLHRDLLEILHTGCGAPGMVSGQIYDLQMERENTKNRNSKSEQEKVAMVQLTHRLKTGALIKAALLLGNRLRKDWKKREGPLSKYGEDLGLLFQITDDILDVEGTQESLGKTPGKDQRTGKITYPALLGMERCKKMVQELQKNLISISSSFVSTDEEGTFFQGLPIYIGQRKN